MISVPNRLLLLNGNSLWILFLIGFLSCAASKKSVVQNQVQVVKADKSNTTVKKDTLYPEQTFDDKKSISMVDTIVKKDNSRDKQVLIKDTYYDASSTREYDLKSEYHIKLLIPLNSDGTSDLTVSRFVHFYAGALYAFESLDDEGVKLKIKVIDTEEGDFKIAHRLAEIIDDKTDMIIGPFEREDLKVLAEACKKNQIPLVSPWQTSSKLTNENPYYIQMKPNLKEHFLKLVESTTSSYQEGEVAIIGRNDKDTHAWIKYFQEAATTSTMIKEFYSTYFVSNDSLNNGPTAFQRLLKNPKLKAIIIPNYSFSDEDFIYGCLRRLTAEKGNKLITVLGMPILYESDKVDFDFYNALQMKVVMSDFVDENYSKIREFRREFLDKYGELPNADAVKGYDLILYLGRNIWKYGKNFQNFIDQGATSYLHSTYDIRKSKSNDSPIVNDTINFDFYENKHLEIIEFKGNKWQRKI